MFSVMFSSRGKISSRILKNVEKRFFKYGIFGEKNKRCRKCQLYCKPLTLSPPNNAFCWKSLVQSSADFFQQQQKLKLQFSKSCCWKIRRFKILKVRVAKVITVKGIPDNSFEWAFSSVGKSLKEKMLIFLGKSLKEKILLSLGKHWREEYYSSRKTHYIKIYNTP